MKTYIIAEAGVNHNGSLETAIKLVDVAADAGADAVKFQTFKAERLALRNAPKADYQIKNTGVEESQFEMLKRLELSEPSHFVLKKHCEERGIDFLSSPFDELSLDFLIKDLKLTRIKVPSGEITNGPYLLKIARHGAQVILSTGMASLDEIEAALKVLSFGYLKKQGEPSLQAFDDAHNSDEAKSILKDKVVILHAVTEYPAPFEQTNLRAMSAISERFGLNVGFSDHSLGLSMPTAAVALGACLIEKHFTLDQTMSGPDHKASLEPAALKEMVSMIRQVEVGLGDGKKVPSQIEEKNKAIVRKSLVAARSLKKGTRISSDDIVIKRPGQGLSPMQYWEIVGQEVTQDINEGDLFT